MSNQAYAFSSPNMTPADEREYLGWCAAAGLDSLIAKAGIDGAIELLRPYGYSLDGDHHLLAQRRVVPALEVASA